MMAPLPENLKKLGAIIVRINELEIEDLQYLSNVVIKMVGDRLDPLREDDIERR